MTQATDTIINDPHLILERMKEIVHNEMLDSGSYIEDEVDENLKERGSVCGGHKACAIGSLWLAGGILPRVYDDPYDPINYYLPGVAPAERHTFLHLHPALSQAHAALNVVAEEYLATGNYQRHSSFSDPIETLFEASFVPGPKDPERPYCLFGEDMLEIITKAQAVLAQS